MPHRDRSTSFGGMPRRPAAASAFQPMSAREPTNDEEVGSSQESLEAGDSGEVRGGLCGTGRLRRFDNYADLNSAISHRPDKNQLVARNILKPDKVAPALAARQAELKKQQLEDVLNNRLAARSNPDELKDHNILKDTNVSPSIQAQAQELKKKLVEDQLNQKLSQRVSQQEAEKKAGAAI